MSEESPDQDSGDIVFEATADVPYGGRGGDLRLIPGAGAGCAPGGDVILMGEDDTVQLTVRPDGTVVFGDHFDPDRAVRAFWMACGEYHPVAQAKLNAAMEAALAEVMDLWRTLCLSSFNEAKRNGALPCLSRLKSEFPNYRVIADDHRRWLQENTDE